MACNDVCVDVSVSIQHCGGCNQPCPLGTLCAAGVCDCPGELAYCAGMCVNPLTSSQHCGGCDQPCAPGVPCIGGMCF
jgi:hypothetical protein